MPPQKQFDKIEAPETHTELPKQPDQFIGSPKKSQAFLLTLTLLLFTTGAFGVWFFNSLFPQITADQNDEMSLTKKDEFKNWKTYTNNKYGFEIKFPAKYEKNTSVEQYGTESFTFSNDYKNFDESVGFSIAVDNDPKSGADILAVLKNPNDILSGPINFKLGNISADRYKLKWSYEGGDYIYSFITFKHAEKIYAIESYGLKPDEDTFNSLVSTFKFNDGNNNIIRNDWGVSFTKQTDWNVKNEDSQRIYLIGTSDKSRDDNIKIYNFLGEKITNTDTKFGPVSYWFDEDSKKWKKTGQTNERTSVQEPLIVDAEPQFYVSGLPVFLGTERWLTYIIPLSHSSFLEFKITGSGNTQPLTDLVKSIKKI